MPTLMPLRSDPFPVSLTPVNQPHVAIGRTTDDRGMSLVEIIIVVVIIGALSSMAIGAHARLQQHVENKAVANDLRAFAMAFEEYALETGYWPPEGDAGVVPPRMTGRISSAAWSRQTPLRGRYDWEAGVIGIRAGISLCGCSFDDARLARLDALIDDGNVATGRFRRIFDGRPVLVLEE